MKKYDISDEFGVLRKFKPPFSKVLFSVAEFVLNDKSKELKSNDELEVSKEKIKTEDGEIINLYIYGPKKIRTNKVLFYIHGGGFVYEGNSTHYKNCRRYALDGSCKVVYVDYRRAPKNPYPIPINDCFCAYKWIIENAEQLKIDTNKIIVGGDSSGGCLAVDVTRRVSQENIIKPSYLMLIYPVLDKRMKTKSMREYTDTPMWNAKLNRKMWKSYLGKRKYTSPNELNDLKDIPSTYLETAEYDCLHDEGIEFANKLIKEGVDVILNETKQTMHGFDTVNCSITEEAMLKRIEALNSIH